MKKFIVITADEKPHESGAYFFFGDDEEDVFQQFLEVNDLNEKEDADEINQMLEDYPVGIGEIIEEPGAAISLEWYFSLD